MNINYDLHIHSGLSPCADNDMSPINILAMASVKSINMIAIADHNSIDNVEVAIKLGDLLHITVVPAIELQTSEDIHFLCLFKRYEDLANFYSTISLQKVKNNEQIFGEQIVYNEDGVDIDHIENLLLVASNISSSKLKNVVENYGGIAIPAHIDREANSIVNILGDVDNEFKVVELSSLAESTTIEKYQDKLQIINSDAHTLLDIGNGKGKINLSKNTAECLLEYLKNYD